MELSGKAGPSALWTIMQLLKIIRSCSKLEKKSRRNGESETAGHGFYVPLGILSSSVTRKPGWSRAQLSGLASCSFLRVCSFNCCTGAKENKSYQLQKAEAEVKGPGSRKQHWINEEWMRVGTLTREGPRGPGHPQNHLHAWEKRMARLQSWSTCALVRIFPQLHLIAERVTNSPAEA